MQETTSEVCESVKDMKRSPIILHFDGKIIQEFTEGRKLRDSITVSVNCVSKNTLLGIVPVLACTTLNEHFQRPILYLPCRCL